MIKSKFYKDVQEGKTTLKALYEQKAVFLHRDKKTFEYIYFYDWTEEVKKRHYGYFWWTFSNKKEKTFYNELLKANNLPKVDFPF